jgi:hypothetical protein
VHSAESVLRVLDDTARSFVFPMLDNGYVYPAAARLAVFRSDADWAVTFETFGFSPRAGMPDLAVTTIGSSIANLKSRDSWVSEEAYRDYLARSANSHVEFFYPIEDGAWLDPEYSECIMADATHLVLRGERIELPGPSAYAEAGILLSEPPSIMTFELARALAHLRRSDVLASAAEREVNLPANMQQLLMLDDWLHPDVVDPDCLPSRSPAFQQLAAVIESGEIGRYTLGSSGNTHWSNWPDGGTL